MPLAPARLVFNLAKRFPALGHWLYKQLLAQSLRRRSEPRWLLVSLSRELGERLPFYTRLGNGMPLQLFWGDYASMKMRRFGYYESESVALIQRLLRPSMVFIDAGAHCGQYTLVASAEVGPGGQVHSFEPDPATFRLLASNVKQNQLMNVVLNQVALNDQEERRPLYLGDELNIGANSLVPSIGFSGQQVETSCLTLDSYLQGSGIGQVDFVKIDVEGAELALLEGSGRLFQQSDPPFLLVELNDHTQRLQGHSCLELANRLRRQGYDLYRAGPRHSLAGYATEDTDVYFNVLAVHPSRSGWAPQAGVLFSAPAVDPAIDFGIGATVALAGHVAPNSFSKPNSSGQRERARLR